MPSLPFSRFSPRHCTPGDGCGGHSNPCLLASVVFLRKMPARDTGEPESDNSSPCFHSISLSVCLGCPSIECHCLWRGTFLQILSLMLFCLAPRLSTLTSPGGLHLASLVSITLPTTCEWPHLKFSVILLECTIFLLAG